MKNAYPEKPILQFRRTSVEMLAAIKAIQDSTFPAEVKRAAYMIFRKESGNGRSGINENYSGFQADSGRWPIIYDPLIAGVVQKNENGTGKSRLFLAFHHVSGCLQMLMDRLQQRGIYIGGRTSKIVTMDVNNITDFARAYKKEWAAGKASAEPTMEDIKGFDSMYRQAMGVLTDK
ncbi:hypothetical protein [Chitinophaga sp. sic0106]|uniref:hypothetical protein n=1 Tax=Chitinophaga sp. sic0106 TaxID=2854785 RepID=UPI001C4813C7|nr:hypothetical protein [Chitinophaga sp. sic0106]MBV7534039.1 hypothetical protein [Chitinophaga sp. sic0106]